MTLIQTIVSSAGIWQVGDNLLWNVSEQREEATDSIKHLVASCSDGGMLIGYTGVGILGPYDVSDWMRRVLRGRASTLDATLIALRDAATADLAGPAKRAGIHQAFVAGVFLAGRPWAVAITNLSPNGRYNAPPLARFETSAVEVPTGQYMVAGRGREAISDDDRRLCARIAKRHPSRPHDFLRVLAAVNRRASEAAHPASASITASTIGVFMPPALAPLTIEVFDPSGAESPVRPAEIPLLLFGVDLKENSAAMAEWLRRRREGREPSEAQVTELLERAGRASVEPTRRLTGGPEERGAHPHEPACATTVARSPLAGPSDTVLIPACRCQWQPDLYRTELRNFNLPR
jgi:hypothetical protein